MTMGGHEVGVMTGAESDDPLSVGGQHGVRAGPSTSRRISHLLIITCLSHEEADLWS